MHTSIVLLVAAVLFGGNCCSSASLGDLVDPGAANAAIGDAAAKANYYLPTVRNPTRISLPTARRQIFGIPNLLGDYFERVVLCHNIVGGLGTSACNSYCVLNNQIGGACDENVCICE